MPKGDRARLLKRRHPPTFNLTREVTDQRSANIAQKPDEREREDGRPPHPPTPWHNGAHEAHARFSTPLSAPKSELKTPLPCPPMWYRPAILRNLLSVEGAQWIGPCGVMGTHRHDTKAPWDPNAKLARNSDKFRITLKLVLFLKAISSCVVHNAPMCEQKRMYSSGESFWPRKSSTLCSKINRRR